MTSLIDILQQDETECIEFKTSFGKAVIETLVAFANTKGGIVYVGVKDNGEILGVRINKESLQNWINEIKQKTTPAVVPDVEVHEYHKKIIIEFSIKEYPVKPVAVQGRYYKRVQNANHLLSPIEISDLHLKTINESWDYYLDNLHDVSIISMEKVGHFIKKIEAYQQLKINETPMRFLNKQDMLRNGKLTYGAYLLFAEEFTTISEIQIGRFKTPTHIIDSFSTRKDLFTEVEEIMLFIKKHLKVEYIITGNPQREERFDYPIEAIREIVLNMIVHRDYRQSSDSVIKIFDDKIEFYNPGGLYGEYSVNDLLSGNYKSRVRNKMVAFAFKSVGWIERYGSGITRILHICREYGVVPPTFSEDPDGFVVTIYNEKLGVKDVLKDVLKNVPKDAPKERREKEIALFLENAEISMQEIAEELNVNIKTIKRDVDFLKQKGILKRIGGRKTGYWKIINNITKR